MKGCEPGASGNGYLRRHDMPQLPSMQIELVTVGTELLLGLTADTNGAETARAPAPRGVRIARRTAVADRPEEIRAAVAERSGAPAPW